MKRHIKKIHLKNLEKRISSYSFLILANFIRMGSGDFFLLRKELKSSGVELMVIKNSLAKIVLKDFGKGDLSEMISGPMCMVFSNDMLESSKLFVSLIKKSIDRISVVCGYHNDKVLQSKDIAYFAQLPPLNDMRASLMAMVAYAPLYRMFSCLNHPSRLFHEKE